MAVMPLTITRHVVATWRKRGLLALGLVLVLNALFAGLAVATSRVPRETIVRRIAHAFETGELRDVDYLSYDSRRGFHQYNDCVILQMIANASSPGGGLGPRLYIKDPSYSEMCGTLREIVVGTVDPAELRIDRYTRYWHGSMPMASVLLTFMDLSTVRVVLRAC